MEPNCYEVQSWTKFSAQLKNQLFLCQSSSCVVHQIKKNSFWSNSRRILELKYHLCLGPIGQNKINSMLQNFFFSNCLLNLSSTDVNLSSMDLNNIPTERLIYKIIQIVRALWLAIKPFYMSVCKHGFRSSFISYL